MEGIARFDFRANQEDEISFRTNEVLKILQLDEVLPLFKRLFREMISFLG